MKSSFLHGKRTCGGALRQNLLFWLCLILTGDLEAKVGYLYLDSSRYYGRLLDLPLRIYSLALALVR